ncbi:hypothetical protein ZIOFF_051770 [Zingiber officinale]|uniref:Transmembrane protein n=1 Tax=Zingiber officinale TaxID=94328 RepID=A0A8J5KS97_ZINOF|nr:hypothetical protein ZIOFF_051770 [Zingiber officinale]
MHRSGSTTRASDEFHISMAAQAMGGSYSAVGLRSSIDMDHHLSPYHPQSEVEKKEVNRIKVAENMVHMIPFVILLCTIVLWFFSHPTGTPWEIHVVSKDDTLVAKIKNTPFHSNTNWNGSSMTIGIEDLDPIDGMDMKHNLKIKSRKYFN